MVKIDIEGLQEFEDTVKAFVNDAKDYKILKQRVKNQRKTLNQQNLAINGYKSSLQFDEDVMKLHDEKYQELIDKKANLLSKNKELTKDNQDLFIQCEELISDNVKLKKLNRRLKKNNHHNKGKLVALNHVLKHEPTEVEIR